jgi:Fe-S-cluster containining protein
MEDFVTGNIKFELYGEPIEMELAVPAKPVKVSRMLPIFQAMTNEFLDIGINATLSKGEKISCTKGCGACCKQPVPIAESEVFQIAELVESFDEPRKSEVKAKFKKANDLLKEKDWIRKMDGFVDMSPKERQTVVMEYFGFGIDCPFLEEGSCSIHPVRPLSCREYLVTTPAENCSKPTAETVKPIKVLFKISEVMRGIGQSGKMTKPNFAVMIRALDIVENMSNEMPEKTGEGWMQDFFGHLANYVESEKKSDQ